MSNRTKKYASCARNVVLNIVLVLATSLLSLEVLSFIGTKFELLIFNDIPSIYGGLPSIYGELEANIFRGRTNDSAWGPWRKPNSVDRHWKQCFDVIYEANSFGARDGSFTFEKRDPRPRYILLGDSFAEGWTVNIKDTAQAHLEKNLGIDIYNFGIAGYVGPVQYYLIYKTLAKKFEHDGVIIFFLPENDFSDNDYDIWKDFRPTWYRPYYKKEADGTYNIIYSAQAKPGIGWLNDIQLDTTRKSSEGLIDAIKNIVKKYFYASNFIRSVRYLLFEKRNSITFVGDTSKYYEAPRDEQEAAVFFLKKIVDESANKKVIIVAVPDIADLERIKSSKQSYKDQYWYRTLKSLEKSKPNVKLIDLAPSMLTNPKQYFHTCDNHWNPLGNKTAADIIAAQFGAADRR